MKRTASRLGLLAVIAIAATIGGCATNPPATLPISTVPTPPSANSPTASTAAAETPELAKQHAIDAYVGMQNAFLRASELGDPSYPDLANYAAGDALVRLTEGLKTNQSKGLLSRGEAVYHPHVESLSPSTSPTKASLRDCMDTSKTSRYKANGESYQDSPGGLRLVLAEVERINGTWKVTSFGVRQVGSCTV